MRVAVKLLYPETRTASAETMAEWYAAAVANGDVAVNHPAAAGDLCAQVAALEDAGLITVCTKQPYLAGCRGYR
jgi:hypothetical protein